MAELRLLLWLWLLYGYKKVEQSFQASRESGDKKEEEKIYEEKTEPDSGRCHGFKPGS